jgi:hypothetical protein
MLSITHHTRKRPSTDPRTTQVLIHWHGVNHLEFLHNVIGVLDLVHECFTLGLLDLKPEKEL